MRSASRILEIRESDIIADWSIAISKCLANWITYRLSIIVQAITIPNERLLMYWHEVWLFFFRHKSFLKYRVFCSSDSCDQLQYPTGFGCPVLVIHQFTQCDHTLVVLQHELILLSHTFLHSFMIHAKQLIFLGHIHAAELWYEMSTMWTEYSALSDRVDELPVHSQV